MFIIYCDPKNTKEFDSVVKAAVAAKKKFPTSIKVENEEVIHKKEEEVIFIISTEPDLH